MTFNKLFEAALKMDKWQQICQQNPMLAAGADLCRKIEALGNYKALIVGGSVRDLLMGKTEVHDVDIATNAPVSKLEQRFKTHDIGKSKDFGIVTIQSGGYSFEVAQFRSEEGYSDGRRPDKVAAVDSFERDSERRDFTINAMAINADGEIIDYHGGVEDINNKVVKAVGDAKVRFEEDALRLVRAVRFAAKFGFELESNTEKAIKKLSFTINNLSPERIRDELFKAAELGGPALAMYIRKLDAVDLLQHTLPEVKALQGLEHNPEHHPEGHVWEHVLAAVAKSPSKDPVDNLAVLFHDLGKATTLDHKEDGSPTYHGHEGAGVPIFDKIADRLKFSNEDREAINLAISEHMHGHNIDKLNDKTILKMRQHPKWNTLRNTIYSDEASRLHLFDPAAFQAKMDRVEALFKHYGDTKQFEAKMSALIDGRLIMSLVPGIKGPAIGVIKDAVRDWIVSNRFDVTADQVKEKVLQLANK